MLPRSAHALGWARWIVPPKHADGIRTGRSRPVRQPTLDLRGAMAPHIKSQRAAPGARRPKRRTLHLLNPCEARGASNLALAAAVDAPSFSQARSRPKRAADSVCCSATLLSGAGTLPGAVAFTGAPRSALPPRWPRRPAECAERVLVGPNVRAEPLAEGRSARTRG
jgi:hypothetical protein